MIVLRRHFAYIALALSLIAASSAVAQEPLLPLGGKSAFSIGTHIFRRCLFEKKFKPLDNLDQLERDSLLIVLGDPAPLARYQNQLRNFVSQGGAVLFATDWEVTPRTEPQLVKTLDNLVGVQVTGEALLCLRPEACYKGHDYQPFLLPIDPKNTSWLLNAEGVDGANHLRVATDLPSRLQMSNGFLPAGISMLAHLPAQCRTGRFVFAPPDGTNPLFAVGGEVGQGKILVLADHSIFINSVMAPSATNNVELTQLALSWLSDKPDGGHRSTALLFTDDTVEKQFEVPLKSKKLSAREARTYAVAYIDAALHQWETRGENGVFNDFLNKIPRLWPFLMAILSFFLFSYLLYRFTWAASFRREPGLALFSRAVALHRPEGPVLGERHEAQIRDNNFFEEARSQARTFFADALGLETCPKTMPKIGTRSWWGRGALIRRVMRTWLLARGKNPKPVTKKQWTAILGDLETLRVALKDQTLRLQLGGKASS